MGNKTMTWSKIKACVICEQEFLARGTFAKYCDDPMCKTLPCDNDMCTNRLPRTRQKPGFNSFCSKPCRVTAGTLTGKKGSPGPPLDVLFACIKCKKESLGLYNSKFCAECCTCRNIGCETRIRDRSLFCTPLCRAEAIESGTYVSEAKRIPRTSKEELSLIPALAKLGYEHSGSGQRWMKWKNGKKKNPDFVDLKNRRVFEYFGSYWHRDDIGKEQEIIDAWAEIGYKCTILWDFEKDKFLADLEAKT